MSHNHRNLADAMGQVRNSEFDMKTSWIIFYQSTLMFYSALPIYCSVHYSVEKHNRRNYDFKNSIFYGFSRNSMEFCNLIPSEWKNSVKFCRNFVIWNSAGTLQHCRAQMSYHGCTLDRFPIQIVYIMNLFLFVLMFYVPSILCGFNYTLQDLEWEESAKAEVYTDNQCCGSGSGLFLVTWIRIRRKPDPDPQSRTANKIY